MTTRNGDMPDYPLVNVEDIIIQNWDSRPLHQQGGFGFHMPRGVKVTHIPTRLVVECEKERNQHKNKHLALLELNALLAELDKARGVIKIDVEGALGWSESPALIVLAKTGVEYSAQTSGMLCEQSSAEGFVIATFDFAPSLDECELGCSDIYPGNLNKQRLAAAVIRDAIKDTFSRTKCSFTVRFDDERTSDLREDWWPVIVSGEMNGVKLDEAKCIYTRQANCD